MKQGLTLMLDMTKVYKEFGGPLTAPNQSEVVSQALELADGGALRLKLWAIPSTFTDSGDFLHTNGGAAFEVLPSEVKTKSGFSPSTKNAADQLALDQLLENHIQEIEDYRDQIRLKALEFYRRETAATTHQLRRGLIVFI